MKKNKKLDVPENLRKTIKNLFIYFFKINKLNTHDI